MAGSYFSMKPVYFYIILVYLLLIHQVLNSQIYFSNRYDFMLNSTPSFSGDIIQNGNTFLLLNESIHGNQQYRLFGFIFLDSMGYRISNDLKYEDSLCGFATGYPGALIKAQNQNGYALIGIKYSYVPNGRWDRGMLWRFDNTLDTLWTKTYNDDPPHDTSFLFRNFRPLPDGSFIIVGSHGLVDGTAPIRINLHRVDSLGNLILRKYYGSGYTHFLPFDVSRTSDNGYIIGSVMCPIDPNNAQDDDPYLLKTDTIGNVQWSRHLGNPDCREEYVMIDISLDGKIICGTSYSDTCWGYGDNLGKINIIKIDNSNTIIWDKKYGIQKHWLFINKIRCLENGDIITTGHYDYYNEITRNEVSWILKTDSAGNELWYREYMLLTATFSQNILYNVIPTSDYGFIACGTVWPYPPDTGTRTRGC